MSGDQHVPEDMTALVRRFKALGFAGHRADQLAVEVRDSLWLAQHDDRVRALPDQAAVQGDAKLAGNPALPDRETIARTWHEAGIAGHGSWDRAAEHIREGQRRRADAVLALFGQEGQR